MSTISALSSGNQVAETQSKSEQSSKTLAGDMNTFLKLLTTQLTNQDPTSPMDTNEFTDQLTKYAGVEQQIATNENLENLIALQSSDRKLRALDYVGAQIEALGNTNRLAEGDDAKVEWIYALDDTAEKVKLTVKDLQGTTVYQEEVTNKSGRQEFTWDGTNNVKNSDSRAEPGNYVLTIEAVDGDGKTVKATPGIRGVVDAIDFDDDKMNARIGDISIDFDTITNVKRATTSTTDSTDSSGS